MNELSPPFSYLDPKPQSLTPFGSFDPVWLVLVASQSAPPLTWGAAANLVPAGETRARYLTAVRAADENNFAPLLKFAQG